MSDRTLIVASLLHGVVFVSLLLMGVFVDWRFVLLALAGFFCYCGYVVALAVHVTRKRRTGAA